jgi:DNA-binding transcriptional ArsR family regulator
MQTMGVVGDPVRCRIVELLGDGEQPAGRLSAIVEKEFGISQPAVSQHLKVLRESGVATMRAAGTKRLYTLDRLSSTYLIALAARVIREVSFLVSRAAAAGKRLPTLSIDTEIRFKTAADRAAFAEEMTKAVNTLAARYHDAEAPGGKSYRLIVVGHPAIRNQ